MKIILTVEDGIGTITIEDLEALVFEMDCEDTEEEVETPVVDNIEEYPLIVTDPVVEEAPIVEPLPSEIGEATESFPEDIKPELDTPVLEEPALVAVPPEVPVKEEITGESNTPEILTTDNVLVPVEETKEEVVSEPVAVDAPVANDPIDFNAPVVSEEIKPVLDEVKEEPVVVEDTVDGGDVEAVLISKDNMSTEQLDELVAMSDEIIEAKDITKKDALLAQLQELVEKLSK